MPSSGGPGGQWNVAALLARRPAVATKNKRSRGARFESRFEYLVQWEDRDPTTGERYEPSWEPTTYITPAAIESYYIDKYEGGNAQRQDEDAAHAAPTAPAGAGDVSAAAPDPAPQKETVTAAATAAAVPAKADNEAVPRRAKNTRADEATPKRQKSTRTANSGTKDKEKQGADGAAVAAAAAAATAPAPRKRGTSPTPDKENTKRIRVADMLLT